jgi:hypothetical protein
MPDLFVRLTGSRKWMCVPASRRMRPGKLVKRDLPLRMTAKLAAAGLADVDFPVGQTRQHGKPGIKGFTLARIIGCGSALSGLVSMA